MRSWLNEYGALPPATFVFDVSFHVLPPSSVRYSSLPMMPCASGEFGFAAAPGAPARGF
jgi:hypothetical protein